MVEEQLGSVESWPSNVLRYMFLAEPNARMLKKVVAFMYRNNVRVSDAVAYYNACNSMHQSYVEASLKAWYFVWDRDECQRHKEYDFEI